MSNNPKYRYQNIFVKNANVCDFKKPYVNPLIF